jgi:hypothetical protein
MSSEILQTVIEEWPLGALHVHKAHLPDYCSPSTGILHSTAEITDRWAEQPDWLICSLAMLYQVHRLLAVQ